MADVTGPISSLPGTAHHDLPKGQKCDYHPDREAVVRYQGETDSFGCEMHDICEECLKEFRAADNSTEARTGQCEWCKHEATDLRDARDYDEGMSGRIYRVCGPCRKRVDDEAREELEASGYFDDCGDDGYATCPDCNGRGTVNPLTAPKGFFCTSATDCPTCEGIGEI
jgi:hypothetical protein